MARTGVGSRRIGSRRYGLKKLGSFVPRAVHTSADGPCGHKLGRIGPQQVLRIALGHEPAVVILGADDHGHPVVNGRDQLVGIGRDDREGPNPLLRLGMLPVLPEPRKGEQLPAFQCDGIGLLARALLILFVEGIGRHEASPFAVSEPECRAGIDALGPGVDVVPADPGLLGPARDQALAQEIE